MSCHWKCTKKKFVLDKSKQGMTKLVPFIDHPGQAFLKISPPGVFFLTAPLFEARVQSTKHVGKASHC